MPIFLEHEKSEHIDRIKNNQLINKTKAVISQMRKIKPTGKFVLFSDVVGKELEPTVLLFPDCSAPLLRLTPNSIKLLWIMRSSLQIAQHSGYTTHFLSLYIIMFRYLEKPF